MKRLRHMTLILLFSTFSVAAEIINFEHTLESSYSVQELWQEFDRAMLDSSNSNVWPGASEVVGQGLVNDGVIEVTYSMGLFNPTYRYLLTVNEEDLSFTYLAYGTEHPFIGGATVTILPGSGNSASRLHWKGTYDTADAGFFARRAFLNFERRFFQELKSNLQ